MVTEQIFAERQVNHLTGVFGLKAQKVMLTGNERVVITLLQGDYLCFVCLLSKGYGIDLNADID